MAKKKNQNLIGGLREVKSAGFTVTKAVKRDASVNRRAGLHDKLENLHGESRVKRRKPLGLKHVRRMRKFAAVASVGVVGAIAVVGVGFLQQSKFTPVEDVGNPTVCFEVPKDGTNPTDHTLVENVGYLNYVLKNQPYWSSETKTTVQAMMGIEQGVDSYKKYYNGILISADCSFSGLSESMQYGEQFCQAYGVVLTRNSTSSKTDDLNKGMDAPWSTGEATPWTVANFRENRGLPPLDFSVYVLNENTIANAQDYSVIDNGDGTYTMSLTLNTDTNDYETSADYYYRAQMQYNGDLNEKPTIYYTTLTYTFDANWRVLELQVNDSYRAKAMGINSNCSSHSVTTFSYDEDSAYNTFWEDYFKAEYERVKDTLTDADGTDKEEAPSAMGYLANAFGSVMTDGAIFKLDLNIDNLDLNGVVSVEMENGNFSGLSAKLGDILVWLDGNTLYINDGASNYKLNTSGLLSSGEEAEAEEGGDLLGGLDIATLMNQMTAGTFIFNEETGVATLNSEVELFGLKIPMEFEFQKTEDGEVELNFLKAEISLGEKVVKAKLCFGTASDKPAIPEDTSAYQDILNDGITFHISLKANDLTLDGVAKIIMDNGAFAGAYADLGDITVYYDYPRNMLYLSVGDVKYKLDISALNAGNTNALALSDAFDIKSLLSDVLKNLITGETYLGTSLNINIDVLESVLKAALNIQLAGGLKVDANLSLDDFNLALGAALSNEEVTLPELTGYQDILNDGVTLEISLNANGFTLDGVAKIIMDNGAFAGVYAECGDITVYYDCPHNMLYLSKGNLKYKLNLSTLNPGNADTLAVDSFDIKSLLSDVLSGLTTSETSLGTSLNINIDALESVLKAALNIQLAGGLKVDANLSFNTLNLSLSAALSNEEVPLPDLSDYKDILNGDITLDVSLTLLTGLTDEATGKRDEVTLEGKVTLCLADGAVAEIRADFGGLAVYLDLSAKSLYVKVGNTKVTLNLAEMDLTNLNLLATLNGGETDSADLPDAVKELLCNLIGEGKIISTNAKLSILNSIVPVWAELDLTEGVSVRAKLSLLGIDAVAKVEVSETALEGLSDEEKEEYVDVLKEGHKIVESLIGNHISATATGTLYSYDEKYAGLNDEKYTFKATVEYENGTVTVNDDGIEVDSKTYVHLNIGLTAKHPDDDSLYLDIVLMDANPNTGADGRTTGGYYKDDSLDIYLSVSKYEQSSNALQIYAPVDEILTLVSMVGAMANLDGITIENSQELTAAIDEISKLLDGMLISKYLPKSVQDKFASLGDSLIPQILGVSLEELLNNLFGNVDDTVKEVKETNFLLSDKYVSSIRTTDESLIFVLNSSLIYNEEIDAEDNLTVTFNRVLKDGVYFVGGASLENVFFGDNLSNKLNLGLKLGYDEILRPDEASAFENYFNAAGLDDLLNAVINSATHSSGKMDAVDKVLYAGAEKVPEYLLNHDYYINGDLKMNLGDYQIPVKVNGLSAHIDENNEVSLHANLFIPKTQVILAVIPITVIENDTYVDLTIKDGLIYVKRTVNSKTEYRIMTLDAFIGDIMNQLKFMFNFSSVVSSIMDSATGNGSEKTPLTFDDYGEYISKLISRYYYDTENSVWDIALNGTSIGGLAGIQLSDVAITFGAITSELDGALTLNTLGIGVKLFDTIQVTGTLNYLNPQYEWVNGVDKSNSTTDLSTASVKQLDKLSWIEVLTGSDYASVKAELKLRNEKIAEENKLIEEKNKNLPEDRKIPAIAQLTVFDLIKEHTDWAKLTSHLGTADYLRFGNGINLSLGSMQYLIEREVGGNIGYQSFIDGVNVLYSGNDIFTYCETDIENIKAAAAGKYSDLDRYDELKYAAYEGEFKYEYNFKASEHDRVSVILVSAVPAKGYDYNANTGYYERTLSFINGCTVQLNGMNDINAYKFGGFYSNADFTGEELTEVTATEGLRVYVKWIPKEVEITYISDVEYSGNYTAQEIDGTEYYVTSTAQGAMNYDGITVLGSQTISDETVKFFGWYMQLDGSYEYIPNATALKAVIDEIDYLDSDVITVTLWAVWISTDFTATTNNANSSSGYWVYDSEFTCNYVGEVSNKIVAATDVSSRFVANVIYKLHGYRKALIGGKITENDDTLLYGKYTEFKGEELKGNQVGRGDQSMTSFNALSWYDVTAATQIKLEFIDETGNKVYLGEKTSDYVSTNK